MSGSDVSDHVGPRESSDLGQSVRGPDASLVGRAKLPKGSVVPIDGRVTGRTIILMRWIAIQGQLLTIILVHFGLGFQLPIWPAFATIAASVLVNMVATIRPQGPARLSDRDAALFLAYDQLQLTLLLYLHGGLTNPFAILLLAPLTVGATVLSRYAVVLSAALNQVCLTVLALWHFPLPWPGTEPPDLPPLYDFGVWAGLSMSSLLIAAYVFRVSQEARRIADALAATQLGLAREQRISALGALAAAAAHELGTPLGTIALVTKELARDIPSGSPYAEDIELLQSQAQRCRDILAHLTRQPETEGGSPYERVPLTALIEEAAAPHRRSHVALQVSLTVQESVDENGEPVVRRSPEIIHGLGNLLQNALQFARSEVRAGIIWRRDGVEVVIADDGPGFPSHVLARIGEPYLSGRTTDGGHMGLGIFIAQTLLERSGASVEFSNSRNGGAHVSVLWPRGVLEESE